MQCTKKLYLDLNTDINPWTNNLNRSLNKNIMMDYVKDYFVTKLKNINLKQIINKDGFSDNINKDNNFSPSHLLKVTTVSFRLIFKVQSSISFILLQINRKD